MKSAIHGLSYFFSNLRMLNIPIRKLLFSTMMVGLHSQEVKEGGTIDWSKILLALHPKLNSTKIHEPSTITIKAVPSNDFVPKTKLN